VEGQDLEAGAEVETDIGNAPTIAMTGVEVVAVVIGPGFLETGEDR